MKKVTMLALALSFGFFSYAQDDTSSDDDKPAKEETRKYRSWSIGADFGWSLLFGDMYQLEANQQDYNSDFGGFDPGVTFNLQKWYTSAWGWRGRAGWMSYSGSRGAYATQSKSTFRGDFSIQLNLAGIGARNRTNVRKDAWIVNAGLGYTWANTIVYKGGQEYLKLGFDQYPQFITDKQKEEKSHNSVYMPFGLEWRYRFSERWDLKIAADAIWSMDDNFDGSETLLKVDFRDVNSDPDLAEIAYGNTTNDFLVYFNVGVNYHFSIFKDHQDPTPIIYADGFTDIIKRIDENEDNIDKLMEDGDNDGVSDYFDKEPDTPEGYMVYGGGQAVDTDGDGIADTIDQDPYSTKGAPVDANGRELDDDGDGVPNGKDLEPDSKPGAFVNHQGITIVDRIGGGGGASEAFLPGIYFDFDKANIDKANYQRLATIARFLQANPDVDLLVVGHTDKVGGESYNFKLSERRAKAAKMALVNDFGIDESRISVEGKGKTQLASKRADINRRAEFQIKKDK